MPNKRITAGGNTAVPAILALEQLGFHIEVRGNSIEQTVVATRDSDEYIAGDPVSVLGLIKLVELRKWNWKATDQEIESTLQTYHLSDLP